MNKNTKVKTITAISAISLAVFSLTACGGSAPTQSSTPAKEQAKPAEPQKSDVKTMRIGITNSDTSFQFKVLQKMKELVEKNSNGSIKVELFPSSQLGGQLSMMQQAQSGSLEATVASTAVVGNVAPEFSLLDLPFLFKNTDVSDKVLDGPVGQRILDLLPAKQLVGLGYWEVGFRDLTNSKGPVKSLDELKGMKIRVMENPLHIDLWKALGANPTPMSFDQVFNALQQKVLDGQENPVQTIYASKLYEAQKYLTTTHHVYSTEVFLLSKSWYDSLTKEQQDVVRKAADEVKVYDRQLSREEAKQNVEALKQKGMVFNDLPDDVMKQIHEKVQPVIDKYSKQYADISKELFNAINEAEKK